MKINVKILQGAECNVEVELGDSIERLKELVQSQLNISPANQRLLHRGKTLQEGTQIKVGHISFFLIKMIIFSYFQDYSLKDGDKLHLVVKKDSTPPASVPAAAVTPANTNTGCIETQTEVLPRVLLEREMTKVLRSHYNSDSEIRKIVSAFVKNIEKKLGALSLDDIERICERLELILKGFCINIIQLIHFVGGITSK